VVHAGTRFCVHGAEPRANSAGGRDQQCARWCFVENISGRKFGLNFGLSIGGRKRCASPPNIVAPWVFGTQAFSSACKFFGLAPNVPFRDDVFHLGLRFKLYVPGPGTTSVDDCNVHVHFPGANFFRSMPETDHCGGILLVGWTLKAPGGSSSLVSMRSGGGGAKQGRVWTRSNDHFGGLNLPLRPTPSKLPYSPGSGARGCKDMDAGVHVPRSRSKFFRSGELILHTGFLLKWTSSLHMYSPGPGQLEDFTSP